MPNPWTGIGNPYTKQEVRDRLKATLAEKNTLGAVHALWTLDGLDAFEGGNIAANEVLAKALKSSSDAVRKTAIALLPKNDESSQLIANSNLLEDKNLHVRLAAILKASELPEIDELYQKMESIAQKEQNTSDKWLNAAIKIYFYDTTVKSIGS